MLRPTIGSVTANAHPAFPVGEMYIAFSVSAPVRNRPVADYTEMYLCYSGNGQRRLRARAPTKGRTIFSRYGKLTRTVPVQLWPALYFGRLGS